jgi:hypothetical protein
MAVLDLNSRRLLSKNRNAPLLSGPTGTQCRDVGAFESLRTLKSSEQPECLHGLQWKWTATQHLKTSTNGLEHDLSIERQENFEDEALIEHESY